MKIKFNKKKLNEAPKEFSESLIFKSDKYKYPIPTITTVGTIDTNLSEKRESNQE